MVCADGACGLARAHAPRVVRSRGGETEDRPQRVEERELHARAPREHRRARARARVQPLADAHRAPERRVAGNLWGREATKLARQIGARIVIPCHFEMFEFNTASPDEFIAEAQRLDQQHIVLECGQRWTCEL